MRTEKGVGRIVGVLLLAQSVAAFVAQFVLLARVSAPPGFLANAAGSAMQVRVSVLLWFAASALTLAVAIAALPVFRQYSERMALLYLALSVLGLSTSAFDNVATLNMLSLSEQYAKALFHDLHFNSITVNPYMGSDSLEPFLKDESSGVFVLALTSNSGSKDFQRLKVGSAPLYKKVVQAAKKWNSKKNIGLVVGATHPRELREIRSMVPTMPFLIPGIGKQGGDLSLAVRYGCDKNGLSAVINAGRSILYASKGEDFASAARAEAIKIRDQINAFRG